MHTWRRKLRFHLYLFFFLGLLTGCEKKNMVTLKVGYVPIALEQIEPTKIQTILDYSLIASLWVNLLDYDDSGNIIPTLADNYSLSNGILKIDIGTKYKTPSGRIINAHDAYLSIKRSIILNSNLHSKIKDIICPDTTLSNINEKCPGIYTSDNSLILNIGSDDHFFTIADMLTNAEYSIIPHTSYNKEDLKIFDFKETSGAYYIDHVSLEESLLIKNPGFSTRATIPSKIILKNISQRTHELDQLWHRGEIDVIHPVFFRFLKEKDSLQESNRHETVPFRREYLYFTDRGLKNFNEEQRWSLYKKIINSKEKPINQVNLDLLYKGGDGSLDEIQNKKIQEKLTIANELIAQNLSPTIGFLREDIRNRFKSALPNLKEYKMKINPNSWDIEAGEEEKFDFTVQVVDITPYESPTAVAYLIKSKYLYQTKDQDTWIKSYTSEKSKAKRVQILNELNFNTLNSGHTLPLNDSSFVTITRKPWVVKKPMFNSGTEFWRIQIE
jgi:hypothetical protein